MSEIIQILDEFLIKKKDEINAWFDNRLNKVSPVLYSSVDLRNSGHKLVPVDTNIFPAGFNNLSDKAIKNAVIQFASYMNKYYPDKKNIAIFTEIHTRNGFYLDNILTIKKIIESSGVNVEFFSNIDQKEIDLISASNIELTIHQAVNINSSLEFHNGFKPDLVISNNDFSSGIPIIFNNIKIPIIPSIDYGWHRRRKSQHFKFYNNIVDDFTKSFPEIDPWLITTEFLECQNISFKDKSGLECIALKADKIIHSLTKKYQSYGIKDDPYLFVKADNGTYGMGIMTITSGDQIFSINKKVKNKMEVIKGGVSNNDIIIQEGIKTIDIVDNVVAEPMVYLMNNQPIGIIHRLNDNKDAFGNLNSSGMRFMMETKYEENFGSYYLIAKLAALAASSEII